MPGPSSLGLLSLFFSLSSVCVCVYFLFLIPLNQTNSRVVFSLHQRLQVLMIAFPNVVTEYHFADVTLVISNPGFE